MHSYFQVSQGILNQIQVWALAGHSRTPAVEPLLHCLGWVLRVVFLLEGERSPQSEVLSAVEQVFIKNFGPFLLTELV